MAEALEQIEELESHQSIHVVISSPGSYLFEIEDHKGSMKFKIYYRFNRNLQIFENKYFLQLF